MPQTAPHFVTLAAAAEYLACSERTLRRHIAAGNLPAYRIGDGARSIRLKHEDVEALARPIPTTKAKATSA